MNLEIAAASIAEFGQTMLARIGHVPADPSAEHRGMNTTMQSGRWFAAWYPTLMGQIDRNGQAEIRSKQLATATGRVLEIGAGSGLSIAHYPADLAELVLLEPNPAFRAQLRHLVGPLRVPATVVDGDVHDLRFPDSSFDTVTASLVLCSVADPARALAEVHRVLRPGGRFLFHEHVRGGPVRGIVQDLLTPLHRRLADGCRANRDFESTLASSPLRVVSIERLRMPTWIPTLVPLVVGIATEPGSVDAVSQVPREHVTSKSPNDSAESPGRVAGGFAQANGTGQARMCAKLGSGRD